ncbi:MAG: maleylpyruvate isomerase N-terminal domain-containing protein [Actinomycetota bacterium]
MPIGVDKHRAAAALEQVAPSVAAVMREIGSPDATAVGNWSAKHVAAHLAALVPYYHSLVKGEGSPVAATGDRYQWNEDSLTPLLGESMNDLAKTYETGMADLAARVRGIEGNPEVPWIAAIPVPISDAIAIALSEALVHGLDLARVAGRTWRIDADHARLALMGIVPTLPHFVRAEAARGLSACFEISLRAEDARALLVFDDGRLSIEDPGTRRVDCHISADPAKYLLVGYGRVGQWGPVLTGKMVAWGRKPWLSLKFATLFESP